MAAFTDEDELRKWGGKVRRHREQTWLLIYTGIYLLAQDCNKSKFLSHIISDMQETEKLDLTKIHHFIGRTQAPAGLHVKLT